MPSLKRITVLLSLILTSFMFAQTDSSPLDAEIERPDRLGAFVTVAGLWQKGSFNVDCNCESFRSGGGTGLSFGALYENTANRSLVWGAQLGFSNQQLDARYVLNEDTTLVSADGKTSYSNIAIPFRHSASISLNSIFVQPYVKWFPFGRKIFIRLGGAADFVFSSNKSFHKTLLVNTVVLPNEDVVQILLDRSTIEASGKKMVSDNEVIIQDGSMTDLNSFQLALRPALGAELRVGKRVLLVPVVGYTLPISSVSSRDTDFKIHALQFSLELHFQL